MEPEAKYTVVGASVLVLVMLLAASVVWLRSSGAHKDARAYEIYFVRQSLGGLRPRGDVLMRGITVGEVISVRFSTRRPAALEVVVAVDPATPIRESTRATVERNLLTGIAAIELSNSSEDSPLLSRAPPGEDLPVIGEGESTMQEVSGTVNQLALSADDAVQRIGEAFSPANRAALAELLDDLRRASKHADATLGRADTTLDSLARAADEVTALARSVSADAQRLTDRYDAVGADVETSARGIADAARRMGADVDRLSVRLDAMIAVGDEEVRSTARALRSAADSVGAAAARLHRDPREVIYGPAKGGFGPGEEAK